MPTVPHSKRRPWQPERQKFKMSVDNSCFYNSTKWRNFAKTEKLAYPLCDNFETCGGVHEITDHPIPINQGGHPFNQRMNHFCKSCNASKTSYDGKKKSNEK